jgi:hypothetical protein
MVFAPVLTSPSEYDLYLDPDHSVYGFAIDHWIDQPPFIASTTDVPEKVYHRQAKANAFQQHGSPVAWHRYAILGFYALDDCHEFDLLWRQFCSKQILCSKVVW